MTKRLYKYIGEKVIYNQELKSVVSELPIILTFSLGNSVLGDNVLPITSLTYSNVEEFYINNSGITPSINDPNWTQNTPTEVIT